MIKTTSRGNRIEIAFTDKDGTNTVEDVLAAIYDRFPFAAGDARVSVVELNAHVDVAALTDDELAAAIRANGTAMGSDHGYTEERVRRVLIDRSDVVAYQVAGSDVVRAYTKS